MKSTQNVFTRLTAVLVFVLTLAACGQDAKEAQSTPPAIPAVGGLHHWWGFGYARGWLVSDPVANPTKSVSASQQLITFTYNCTKVIVGTTTVARVEVVTAITPSKIWESGEFDRLVAVYGGTGSEEGDKNVVTASDVAVGAGRYLGQRQERICALVAGKSLRALVSNPGIGFAEELGKLLASDQRSPFEFQVQTTKVVLPEELMREIALRGLDAVAPLPKPRKVSKRPASKPATAPHEQQCSCTCSLPTANPSCK